MVFCWTGVNSCLGPTLFVVRILVVLPMLTAVLAVVCVLWQPARRFLWPVVALAAVNVVLTPFTSGEWFYQHAESASYQQAVTRGDYTVFDDLLGRHDPHLLPRMIGLAAALLVSLAVLAVLQGRANRGKPVSGALSAIAAGAILLSAVATLVQGLLLVS